MIQCTKRKKSKNVKTIMKAMIDKDLDYKMLGEQMGFTIVSVRRWLCGMQPITPENLSKLEEILEIELDKNELKTDLRKKLYLM